jgi:hypothetical protein
MLARERPLSTVDSPSERNTLSRMEACSHEAEASGLLFGQPEGTDVGAVGDTLVAVLENYQQAEGSLVNLGVLPLRIGASLPLADISVRSPAVTCRLGSRTEPITLAQLKRSENYINAPYSRLSIINLLPGPIDETPRHSNIRWPSPFRKPA